MKKNKLLMLVTLCIACFSCKKDSTSTQPPAAVPYMSVTAGSSWQYQVTNNINTTPPTTYSLTSTSRDTSINSKSYHVFTNSTAGLSEYYNITGADYYAYRNLAINLGNSKLEILYLKDNTTIGDTWKDVSTINIGIPVMLTITNKVEEKGSSRTVNNIAYKDVIHISSAISSNVTNTSQLSTDIHNYYAPKVGVIETTYKVKLNYFSYVSDIDTKTILLSSDIK